MNNLVNPKKIFGCKLKNKNLLMQSQSGGAFTAISQFFLKNGAIVYGCGMDENNNAVYKRVICIEDLVQIKGSKYIQSKIVDVYSLISKDLKDGKTVLFSGTPCYVSAVKNYFVKNENYDNLFLIDLICHGVPSPLVYHEYLKSLEKKKKNKIVKFIFRDKKKGGWHKHVEKIVYANGDIEYKEAYTQLFYTNLPLRPSCGECKFSSIKRSGDFTVGDYWGIQEVRPEFDDNCGVSLLFVNSERALSIFEKIKSELEYFESDEDKAIKQPNLKGHSIIPANKEQFWKDFLDKGINYCIAFYSPVGIPFRIKRKINYLLNKFH